MSRTNAGPSAAGDEERLAGDPPREPATGRPRQADRPPRARLRPKDAATLIVLRRDKDAVRMLMGRRSDAHVFMPGAVVFPGGRVDRGDRFAPAFDDLHPEVERKLLLGSPRSDPKRARAIALAAIRETFEETGILIGRPGAAPPARGRAAWLPFLKLGILPSLAPLRLVARAITPTWWPRRFDARFFAVFADSVAAETGVPDDELRSPAWLSFEETRAHPLPEITRLILDSLHDRLQHDPDLSPDGPVPFHTTRHGRRRQELL